jgi:IclR helix-turn-helix domain
LQTAVCRGKIGRVPERANLSISITLSAEQVEDVLRSASRTRASSLAALVAATLEPPGGPAPGAAATRLEDRRLSRSLVRGLAILACFTVERPERGILELARELELSASTTHRYVLTLLELGLLERSPRSRRYRLARPGGGPPSANSREPPGHG